MSGGGNDDDSTDDSSGSPVDFDRLSLVAERFATDERFTRIEVEPEFAPDRIVCLYDSGFYLLAARESRRLRRA